MTAPRELVRQMYADNIRAVIQPTPSEAVATALAVQVQRALEAYPDSLTQAVVWAIHSYGPTDMCTQYKHRMEAQYAVIMYAALYRADPFTDKGDTHGRST